MFDSCVTNFYFYYHLTINYTYFYRTTKTGGLPNLSFVMRKSNPLGSKFKNIVNEMAGIIIWLEIQEGKDRTYKENVSEELDGIASCVIR